MAVGKLQQGHQRRLGVGRLEANLLELIGLRSRAGGRWKRGQILARETAGSDPSPDRRRHPKATDQSRRCIAGDHAPRIHDRDAVTQDLGFLHVVRGQHDGSTAVPDIAHRLPQMTAGLGIEPGGRLVEEDDPGPVDECQGDREALLLAA